MKQSIYDYISWCDKEKLKKIGLLDITLEYLDRDGIVNVDLSDLNIIMKDKNIINYYYGLININEDLAFNFVKNDNSDALLIIESNNNFTLNESNKIIQTMKNSINNLNVIYGLYCNRELPDGYANILFINTGN